MHLAFIMMLRRELCMRFWNAVAEGAEQCSTAEQVYCTQGGEAQTDVDTDAGDE